ncbi:MAG: SpoIIIAH-like family protein [Bacillota bacterium]
MTVFRLDRKAVWVIFFLFLSLFGLGLCLGIRLLFPRPSAVVTTPALTPSTEKRIAPENGTAATFRLARDMELSRQYERLRDLIEAEQTAATVRQAAEEALWRLIRTEAAEHEAETVLALQGWPGATVSIVGDEATVVVSGRSLSAAEAARIGRLVAEAAGLPESAVRILEKP